MKKTLIYRRNILFSTTNQYISYTIQMALSERYVGPITFSSKKQAATSANNYLSSNSNTKVSGSCDVKNNKMRIPKKNIKK